MLVLVGVGLAVAWVWFFGLPGRGVTVVLRPIDGATALMVRGTGRDATLFRVDARGTPLWRARIASFVDPFVPWGGLAISNGLVAYGVQVGHDGTVHARSLADGSEVWTSALRWYDTHESVVDSNVFAAGTPGAFVFVGGGSPVRLTGFDVKDGATMWRRDLFGTPDHLWVRGSFVLVAGKMNGESYRIDAHEGRLRSVGSETPCVTDDEIVYQTFDRLAKDSFAGGKAFGRQAKDDSLWMAGPCGVRGGDLVMLANGIDRAVLLGRAPDLDETWRVELRGLRPVETGLGAYADLLPLARQPARFVPMLLATRGSGELQLVVFDLDARAEAWRSPPSPKFAGFALYRRGDVDYLMDTTHIAAIDGATGDVLSAVRITGGLPLQPYHVAGGKLWIATPSGRVGTLDGRTLVPDAQVDGIVVNDDRPAFAQLLGRPFDDAL